ncbi:autotransporter outer membrane beta-barrel domain-containing protein [Serratia ureilytica]|uniref:autotransporter outer membrane beta-barrel domain-containing protein n=1 Tax=Serratia ureilytica TaxID=300181 RepID=UPI001D17EDD6|nr:autotransporter outer membrane beta-barrel domain-containing protein [Serratia ureilytica]MCC4106682.1 autotransporter outer membrane beta-barrel domain-containing protein [Serratia ureilytica]
MNHVFRVVFNPALRAYQAVSELVSGCSSSKGGGKSIIHALLSSRAQSRFRYSAIILALFSVGFSFAEEHRQIVVDDPKGNVQLILAPGDTINHIGSGPAILVSQVGNSFTGEKIGIRADSTDRGDTPTVLARSGGVVFLSNSTVENVGTGSNAYALFSRDTGSSIAGTGVILSTEGTHSHGAMAQRGGKIVLNGGTVTTIGNSSDGLHAKDTKANITAKNVAITVAAGRGAYAGPGASIRLEDSTVANKAKTVAALYANGANALISLQNTDVHSANGPAVVVQSGVFEMKGGSLTAAGDAVRMTSIYNGPAPVVNISDAKLNAGGEFSYGLNINSMNARAVIENVQIRALGPYGSGVWLPSAGSSLTANRFDIRATYLGIDNRAGRISLDDGILKTEGDNAHALYVAALVNNQAVATVKNVQIETLGEASVGVLARFNGSSIGLQDVKISTYGDKAYGLYATGKGASLTALNSTVITSGVSTTGLFASNSPTVSLNNVQLTSKGGQSHGIWSYATAADITNSISVTNGSRIDTQDGLGVFANGGSHAFYLENSTITARTGGAEDRGVLLYSKSADITTNGVAKEIETGPILLDAKRSQLTGDILIDSGSASISLANGSRLVGAVNHREQGRVSRLALDSDSDWHVRNNSALGALENNGTVAFLAPGDGDNFKTMVVNRYRGNGTLVLNTRLGDDNSLTDRLVIDGGKAEGETGLRVINAGGAGGVTQYGIRLVETINGGTTGVDAFRLDAASTGYRAGTSTLAINGYDYSLVRGGNQGVPDDWYLTSSYTPPVVPPVTPPTVTPPTVEPPPVKPPIVNPPTTEPPVILPPPVTPGANNVSPESGAYIGNQLASARLFIHNLRDRVSVAEDGNVAPNERGLWVRTQGRHDKGMRMAEGRVGIKSDSSLLQLGRDVLHFPVQRNGAAYVGVMSGYGTVRTDAVSTLILPGQDGSAQAKAKGKMSGYAVGVYATLYENDATHQGGYADAWLQYGRYSNQIGSELGSTSYHSNVWSASLETGYAMASFSAGSALGGLVTEPNAQFIYSDYRASDAALQGTRMRSGADNAWLARAGLRVYPQRETGIRPFLETNLLRHDGKASVQMGNSVLEAALARSMLEMKLGAAGDIKQNFQVSGHLFGQAGNNGQQGYGGMLNMRYQF